jgi:hypothetical protein
VADDRLIHWICTSPAHRRSIELGLTRHQGQWALCCDLLSDGHAWLDTGGVALGDAVTHWRYVTSAGETERSAAA